MRVGFIGLGNVGGKLASSLIRNGFELMVNDPQHSAASPLLESGAKWGENGAEVARYGDVVITCLPSLKPVPRRLKANQGF